MTEICIRAATPEDTACILTFVTELAVYEKAEHEVTASREDIYNSLFTDNPTAHALICIADNTPIGFAVYFYNYSTWLGKPGLYLEDLYVQPEHRGKGAGKALLHHLARIAVQNNCGRFEWSVLDWNEPAIQFYRSLGAKPQDEWTTYRLDSKGMAALAAEGTSI